MIKYSHLMADDYGGDESISLAMAMRRVTSKLAAAAWGYDLQEFQDASATAASLAASLRHNLVRSESSAFIAVGTLSRSAGDICEDLSDHVEDRHYNRSPKVSKTSSNGTCDRASPSFSSNNSGSPIAQLNPENTRKHLLEEKAVGGARVPSAVVMMTLELSTVFNRIATTTAASSSNGMRNYVAQVYMNGGYVSSAKNSVRDGNLRSEASQGYHQHHHSDMNENSFHNNTHDSGEESNVFQVLSTTTVPLHANKCMTAATSAQPKTTIAPDKKYKRRTSLKSKDNSSTITTICEESAIMPSSNETSPKQRKCLTAPSKPESNSGLDNEEGNLIVYQGDIIEVPNSSFSYLDKSKSHDELDLYSPMATTGVTQFQVTNLLGQGTFAQVFQCVNVATAEQLAIKIIKNKPAYTRQASVEIEIFKHLLDCSSGKNSKNNSSAAKNLQTKNNKKTYSSPWVNLECYFFYQQHLCLVFELLGCNLYEVLKKRQFVGLPLAEVKSIVWQSLVGIKRLAEAGVVHCDCKPENIVVVEAKTSTHTAECEHPQHADTSLLKYGKETMIKVIDFGSAAFEGQTTHSYIQSRFYRSPEVLIGLPYDSAIDVWSLGCVAAELFLGLPILPGMHEHDQLGRIAEMIGPLPDSMVEKCTKVNRYFVKSTRPTSKAVTSSRTFPPKSLPPSGGSSTLNTTSSWRLKTREEYAATLPESQRAADLQAQNANRYFKRKKLEDIVMLHGHGTVRKNSAELISLKWFIHLLKGMLEPDPHKRWTAKQALGHPFFSPDDVAFTHLQQNSDLKSFTWKPSWDPSILRRQLQYVERTRNMKTPKSIRKQSIAPDKSYVKERAQQSEATSPSTRRRSFISQPIIEHPGDISAIKNPYVDGGKDNGSPPPSTAFSTTSEDLSSIDPSYRINTYTTIPSIHAATFNPNLVSSPRYLGGAAYLGLGEMHLSPCNYQLGANNGLSVDVSGGGLHMSTTQPNGQSMASNRPVNDSHGQDGFDYVTAQYGSLPLYIAVRATVEPQHVFDRAPYLPIQGELGYALTRPGVVPGNCNFDFVQHQQASLQQSQQFSGFGASPGALSNVSMYNAYAYSPQMNMVQPDSVPFMHGGTTTNLPMRRAESGINVSGPAYSAATETVIPLRSHSLSFLPDDMPYSDVQLGEQLECSTPQGVSRAPKPRAVTSLLAQQLAAHEQAATHMHTFFPQPQQMSPYSFRSSQLANEALTTQMQFGHVSFPHQTYGGLYHMNAPHAENSGADSLGRLCSGAAVCINNPMVSGHNYVVDAGNLGKSYGVEMPAVFMEAIPASTFSNVLYPSTDVYIPYSSSSSVPDPPGMTRKKQQSPHQAGTHRR